MDDVDDSAFRCAVKLSWSVPDSVVDDRRLSSALRCAFADRLFRITTSPIATAIAIPAAIPPTTPPTTTPELVLVERVMGADVVKGTAGAALIGEFVAFMVVASEGATVGSEVVMVGEAVTGITTGMDEVGAVGP
jgi:hypothetical protein